MTESPDGRTGPGRAWAEAAVYVVAPLVIAWGLLAPDLGRRLTPDAAAYWLLAGSLGTDHPYRVFAVRDFFAPAELPVPSRSFPPLYPVLLAAWDRAFAAGPRSGAAVNLVGVAFLLAVGWRFARSLAGRGWPVAGLAVAWVVVSDPHFREETAAGTPMPWHYALVLAAAWLAAEVADRPARPGPVWVLGIVLGLLALTRFDQALFVAGLGAGLAAVISRRAGSGAGARVAARVAVAAGLVLAPWLARNVAVFGTPWAVDNAVTVASTDPHTVILCAYEGNRPPSGRDDPWLWVGQRVGYALRNLARWNAGFLAGPLVGLAGALLVARWDRLTVRTRVAVLVLGWNVAASWAGLSLTPFEHERYYSPWYAFTLIAALILVDHLLPDAGWRPVGMGLAAATVFATATGYEPLWEATARPDWRWRAVPGSPAAQVEAFKATVAAGGIGTSRPVGRLVAVEFDWDRQPDFHAEAYHALTGVPTTHLPFHVAGDGPAFRDWMRRWRPDYLLTTHEWALRMGFGPFVVADVGVGRVLIDAGRID